MKITLFSLVLFIAVFYSCKKEVVDSNTEINGQEMVLKAGILSDHDGKNYDPGDAVTINWDFAPNFYDWSASKIDIDLYADDVFISNIAKSVDFDLLSYMWIVPNEFMYDNLKLRITNVSNSNESTFSEGHFSIGGGVDGTINGEVDGYSEICAWDSYGDRTYYLWSKYGYTDLTWTTSSNLRIIRLYTNFIKVTTTNTSFPENGMIYLSAKDSNGNIKQFIKNITINNCIDYDFDD